MPTDSGFSKFRGVLKAYTDFVLLPLSIYVSIYSMSMIINILNNYLKIIASCGILYKFQPINSQTPVWVLILSNSIQFPCLHHHNHHHQDHHYKPPTTTTTTMTTIMNTTITMTTTMTTIVTTTTTVTATITTP